MLHRNEVLHIASACWHPQSTTAYNKPTRAELTCGMRSEEEVIQYQSAFHHKNSEINSTSQGLGILRHL